MKLGTKKTLIGIAVLVGVMSLGCCGGGFLLFRGLPEAEGDLAKELERSAKLGIPTSAEAFASVRALSPDQNAAIPLMRMHEAMIEAEREVTPDQMRAFLAGSATADDADLVLSAYGPAVQLAEEASKRAGCSFPREWDQVPLAEYVDITSYAKMGQILAAASIRAGNAGKSAEAERGAEIIAGLARHLQNENFTPTALAASTLWRNYLEANFESEVRPDGFPSFPPSLELLKREAGVAVLASEDPEVVAQIADRLGVKVENGQAVIHAAMRLRLVRAINDQIEELSAAYEKKDAGLEVLRVARRLDSARGGSADPLDGYRRVLQPFWFPLVQSFGITEQASRLARSQVRNAGPVGSLDGSTPKAEGSSGLSYGSVEDVLPPVKFEFRPRPRVLYAK